MGRKPDYGKLVSTLAAAGSSVSYGVVHVFEYDVLNQTPETAATAGGLVALLTGGMVIRDQIDDLR